MAQTRPIKGDIQGNIENHKRLIDLAISQEAGMIVFPELSLTGYEPALAQALATDQDDGRLDVFQELSDANGITIGAGVPTRQDEGICISMILFQPYGARQTYSKEHLHPDEEEFFVSGQSLPVIKIAQANVALAICYELSVPEHARKASESGAAFYIASVAKSARGVAQASKRLSAIAREYSMPVLMSNCVGRSDDFESAGRSSVWNHKGALVGQLDDVAEGIIVYDSVAQEPGTFLLRDWRGQITL